MPHGPHVSVGAGDLWHRNLGGFALILAFCLRPVKAFFGLGGEWAASPWDVGWRGRRLTGHSVSSRWPSSAW